MVAYDLSYFADFEQVKYLVVISLTLNKSKNFSSHFTDFEQVKNFSSQFTDFEQVKNFSSHFTDFE